MEIERKDGQGDLRSQSSDREEHTSETSSFVQDNVTSIYISETVIKSLTGTLAEQ